VPEDIIRVSTSLASEQLPDKVTRFKYPGNTVTAAGTLRELPVLDERKEEEEEEDQVRMGEVPVTRRQLSIQETQFEMHHQSPGPMTQQSGPPDEK